MTEDDLKLIRDIFFNLYNDNVLCETYLRMIRNHWFMNEKMYYRLEKIYHEIETILGNIEENRNKKDKYYVPIMTKLEIIINHKDKKG